MGSPKGGSHIARTYPKGPKYAAIEYVGFLYIVVLCRYTMMSTWTLTVGALTASQKWHLIAEWPAKKRVALLLHATV